jgi:hypothetical protein
MNVFQKIVAFFTKSDEKISEDNLIVTEAVDPAKIDRQQVVQDLQALEKLDSTISQAEKLIEDAPKQDAPEYVDGLAIKNPFIGE